MEWLGGMGAELDAEVDQDRFAELARGWLTGTLDEVIPDLAADLRARPVVRATTLGNADAGVPWGEPGHVLAWVGRHLRGPLDGREVPYTQRTWERTLSGLDKYQFGVSLRIYRLDERGFPTGRGTDEAWLRVSRSPWPPIPGLVHFQFSASAEDIGRPDAMTVQDRWARFVKGKPRRYGRASAI